MIPPHGLLNSALYSFISQAYPSIPTYTPLPPRWTCTISLSRILQFYPLPPRASGARYWRLKIPGTSNNTEITKTIMSKLSSDKLLSPVPRDIAISQAIEGSLPHITKVAKNCGILESELEPYGRFKAKASANLAKMTGFGY